jgi:hypothetical protein
MHLKTSHYNSIQCAVKNWNLLFILFDYSINNTCTDRLIASHLQCGKAAGIDNIMAEHILHAHPALIYHLTKLCNLILIHDRESYTFRLRIGSRFSEITWSILDCSNPTSGSCRRWFFMGWEKNLVRIWRTAWPPQLEVFLVNYEFLTN